MEIKIISLLLMATLIGCNNHPPSEIVNNHIEQPLKDSSEKITISNKTYYQFNFKGDTAYTIEWGNESFKNETKCSFEVLGSGTLGLLKSGNGAIVLSQGCGTSCVYYVVLPFKIGSQERIFMQAIAYDISKSLVAYIPEEEPLIRIENYLTGQKLDVTVKNLCPAAFKGDCLDSSYFQGDHFILRWQGSKWQNNKPDPQEKIVSIEF